MEFVPLVLMTALVKKIVDFVKYLTNADVNALITQIVAWISGIVIAWLGTKSALMENFAVNGVRLGDLDAGSIVFAGVNLASLAGFGWDALKAWDNSNSAIIPNLLGSTSARQGAPGSPTPVQNVNID